MNRLEKLFNEEERKNWLRVLRRLSENPAFGRLVAYVSKKTNKLNESDIESFLNEIEPLLDKFVPLPLGSRILNPNLAIDFIAKYIIDLTGMSVNDFHTAGQSVQDEIKTARTYLVIPRKIFKETDFNETLRLIGATAIHLPKLLSRTLGVIGQHASSIVRGASENRKFAQILFRHGILDMNEDNSFTIHFDRLITAFGDPSFIEEVSDYMIQYIPTEVFYGPQSVLGIALSRSIINGLLAAAVAAKNSHQQEKFVNRLSTVQKHLETIHEQLTSLSPNWSAVNDALSDVFSFIDGYIGGTKKEFPPLYRISQKAEGVGIYPDLVLEAAGLAMKEFVPSEWEWIERTQEVAIETAARARPLYRQPIYWLSLTCVRIYTAPDSIIDKVERIMSQFAAATKF